MSFHWFHVSLVSSYSTTGPWKHLRHVVQGDAVKMSHVTPSESSEPTQVWSCDAPGLLHGTIWRRTTRKWVFLTKSEHFQNIIGRWPDKPSVCRRLAPTSSDQQQESAATSRARWWIALLPKSAERRVRTFSPSRRAFSDVLHSYFRETNLRVVTLKHARCCL